MDDQASFTPMNHSASQRETAFARYASKTDRYRPEEIESVLAGRTLRDYKTRKIRIVTTTTSIAAGAVLAALARFAEHVPWLGDLVTDSALSFSFLDNAGLAIAAGTLIFAVVRAVQIRHVERKYTEQTEHARMLGVQLAQQRMIHPGSHQVTIRLGESGMRFDANRYELRFKWSGFSARSDDFEALVKRDVLTTATAPPLPNPHALALTSLERFLEDPAQSAARQAYLGAVKAWCKTHRHIDLPLRPDEEAIDREYNRLRKAAEKANKPLPRRADVAWIDFVRVPDRFFANGSSELSWEAFVAGALFRIAHAS